MKKTNNLDAALSALITYRDELRRDLSSVERSIELLSGDGKAYSAEQAINAKEYATLKVQAAVERFLETHPDELFKPSAVKNELLRRGFVPTNKKTLGSAVHAALARAVVKDFAEQDEDEEGLQVFSLKKKGSGS